MIKTIFYFVPTLLEYLAKLNSGEIASRTIVFVADNRSIYKAGVRYGGYNNSELDEVIDGKLSPVIVNINTALQSIADLNDDIDNFIRDKQQELKDVIEDTFDEYAWLKKNLGDVFASQGFQDQLNGFLTAVGVIKDSGAAWTTLLLTINSITGRIVNIENGTVLESLIQGWISEGVAGIDLDTYALKADLDDYLKTGDLNNELDGTNAFVQLRSDVNSAKAAIGAWSQEHSGSTITQLLGLLQTDVNNLNNTVTTSLSSTIRQYLGNDLNSAVDTYLQNQAGLILTGNLDGAVANLFAQSSTSSTKDAVNGLITANTAGFIATTNLTGAIATQYADNGGDLSAAIEVGIKNDIAAGNATSFINAIADKLTVKGNVNIVNADDHTVANITTSGQAMFWDGHIYMPDYSYNWMVDQKQRFIGLCVDSVGRERRLVDPSIAEFDGEVTFSPIDLTYLDVDDSVFALHTIGDQYYQPRTLLEPDGLRFENGVTGDEALAGAIKAYVAQYNSVTDAQENVLQSYGLYIAAHNPDEENRQSHVGIILEPALQRTGHESTDGYCKIYNRQPVSTHGDYLDWTGKMEIKQWHSIEMEARDEIVLKAHGQGNGVTLHGVVTLSDDSETHIYHWDDAGSWTTSDERTKTIVSNAEPSIEDIAATRLVNFTFNGDETNTVHTGSIAQDWQNIIPNAVTEKDGKLLLDYTVIATASAITAAREIVKLKQENEDLKNRLAAIEAKLGIA